MIDVRPRVPTPLHRQAGFGIVELMVGMVLGLLIIGGAASMFVHSHKAYGTNDAVSRIQENMRSSFEIMAKELRQAGGTVCGTRQMANVLNTTDWSSNWDSGAFIGYQEADNAPGLTTGTGATNRVSSTDAVRILSGTLGESTAITAQDPGAHTITLKSASGFNAGDIVIACDGATAAIFQITKVTSNMIEYAKDAGSPGNCSTDLGFPTVCAGGTEKLFTSSGYLTHLTASTWYIGFNATGGRSLYRKTASATEEIAENVTDLQLDYLTRNKADQELNSVDWTNTVTDWTEAAATEVAAVRVTLDVQSPANAGMNNQAIAREAIFVANLRSRSQ